LISFQANQLYPVTRSRGSLRFWDGSYFWARG
jgi:hypothetical protein